MNIAKILLVFMLFLPTAKAEDKAILIHEEDIEMNAAIRHAKKELPSFLSEHENPQRASNDFKVKVMFKLGDTVEYMWVTPFRKSTNGFEGKLKNQPDLINTLHWGQTVTFSQEQIIDWAYTKNGKVYGHYTTCVVLGHEPPEVAEHEEKEIGLNCKLRQ